MKKVKFWALLLPLLFVACKSAKYPDLKDGLYADIQTNHGDMLVELFYKATPGTVANFVSLAEGTNTYVADSLKGKRYYDGTKSHRVIKNFMLQAGDRTATGEGSPGYQFADEFVDSLKFTKKGQLAMANSGPATNGSQFFIVQNQHLPYSKKEIARGGWPEAIAEIYAEEGGTPHLDRRHTVFGQLMDEASYQVLDTIAAVETGAMDKPKEDVVMESIDIEGDA